MYSPSALASNRQDVGMIWSRTPNIFIYTFLIPYRLRPFLAKVMFKYVTAPIAIPGTPEWGTMLNVKEDLAKDAWMEEMNK